MIKACFGRIWRVNVSYSLLFPDMQVSCIKTWISNDYVVARSLRIHVGVDLNIWRY